MNTIKPINKSLDNYIIRALNHDELHQLLELYKHLNKTDEPIPNKDMLYEVWNEIMGNSRLKYFGIFDNESIVSSCTLAIIPNLTRGCKPYGIIENVVTHSFYRNKGLGKFILVHALDHAWKNGCYKVMLSTGSKNPATLKFYESAGFVSNEKQAFIAKNPKVTRSTKNAQQGDAPEPTST
jgi:GNAT superfamily N-acetyltransferase